MRTESHLKIGALSGGFAYLISAFFYINFSLGYFIITCFLGLIGGCLPDLFEPPNSWQHRGTFHSIRLLLILVVFFIILFSSSSTSVLRFFFIGGLAGYISHLFSDATTPAGLPF